MSWQPYISVSPPLLKNMSVSHVTHRLLRQAPFPPYKSCGTTQVGAAATSYRIFLLGRNGGEGWRIELCPEPFFSLAHMAVFLHYLYNSNKDPKYLVSPIT